MRAAERELAAIEGSGIGSMVRSAQVMQSVTSISQALSALWMAMGDLVRAGQQDAQTVALRMAFDWDAPLFALEISAAKRAAMKSGLGESGRFNVEAAIARVYKSRIPLAQQVYKTAELTRGWVEHRVTLAIARGATPAQLAGEVRAFINPNTPGGASYAAKRLARTEINNAYHAVIVVHNEDKPWVSGMKWNLSGSHPALDVCDDLARRNKHNKGPGVFPRSNVPRKPHPQCLCYVTPLVISDDEFVKRYQAGRYDGYIGAAYGA